MKIEEMIEKLRYKANNIKAKIEPEFFNEVADMLEKQIGKDINVTSKNDGWISIDDRLPEDNVRVLIYVEWNCILIALRRNGEWNGHWENYEDDDVLAWMPLPEQYKKDGGIEC